MQMNAVRTLTVRGQSQGLDRVEADLNKVSAAQEKVSQTSEGMARTTETSSRRQLSAGKDFQRLMERNDRLVYLQTQLARETATVNRAFEQGVIDAQRHAQAVEMVEGKYRGLVAAEQRARAASHELAVANDNQAASLHRLAAANDNARGATANVAAQFQDIGVTAAMGMNPIMIALQQGTQLSAVLNTMQNPIRGLATAFISIINPVSLLTIGFVALTAAAIQFFTSSEDEAKEAANALEEHDKWLDSILAGYDSVREAAERAGAEARKLPQAEVGLALSSDLAQKQQAYADALAAVQRQVLATSTTQETLTSLYLEGGEAALMHRDALLEIQAAAQAANPDLDGLAFSLKAFIQNNPDSVLRNIADAMLANVDAARDAEAAMAKTGAAAGNLGMELQDFASIRSGIQKWVDESRALEAALRAAAAAMQASLNAALQAAQGYGTAAGAANVYAGSLQRLQALIPAVAAAQAAQNQLASATIEYDKGVKALDAMVLSRDAYLAQHGALTSAFEEAKANVTGLAAVEEQLATITTQNSIDALSGREQAMARVNQQYADQAKAIETARAHGADQAEVDRLLALNNEQLAAALSNTNAQFDRTEAASGGAAKALKAAEKDFNSFISTADRLAEALFPGDYARREALELQAALDMYGDSLDALQRKAVESEIADLFKASELGLRNLEDTTKDAGRNMADALTSTLGSVLQDLFSKPIEDFDDFLARVMSGFAQLGQQNLSSLFEGGGAGSDNGGFNLGDTIKDATAKGSAQGIFAGFDAWFGQQTGTDGTGMGGSMLSAGLGGFGMGYQAQNPIMGAIGGAMSGFAAGAALGGMAGPIGAVVGGIAGLVGGLLGMSAAADEAAKKLENMKGKIDNLIAVGHGTGVGTFATAFNEYRDQSAEAQQLAIDAGDNGRLNEIRLAYNDFVENQVKEWEAMRPAILDALNTGQGPNSAFLSASAAAKEMGEQIKAFVADAVFFGSGVEEMQDAAQSMALTMLTGADPLTDVQRAIEAVNGTASALQLTLEQLGMSSDEAAAAIRDGVGQALDKLREQVLKDIGRSINELSGQGYLNEVGDAVAAFEARLTDLGALGLDSGLAMQELTLRLADIASTAGLTEDQILGLATVFPQLSDLVSGLAGQIGAVDVDQARADLRTAYEAEAGALQEVIDRNRQFITSLRDFRDGLRLDGSLSPLDPQARLNEAAAKFADVSQRALAGDAEAIGDLEGVSRQYLEEARAYYASSDSYFQIFGEVERILDQTLAKAELQVSEAQRQLDAMTKQVELLGALNTNVMSVAEAILRLTDALAQQQQTADPASAYLRNNPDVAQAIDSGALSQDGMSRSQLADYHWRTWGQFEDRVPMYANGTDFHPGGSAWVGGQGKELVNLPRGAQVIPHQQSMALARGAANDDGLVQELRSVGGKLDRLIAATAIGQGAVKEAASETAQEVRALGKTLARESLRRSA